jgi:ataxin-3
MPATVQSAQPAASIGHIYFEQQNLFLCGVHCLNNLLQSARFGPGDLAEMAMHINRQERELGIISTPDANSCGNLGFFSVQVLAHALSAEGFAMHCTHQIINPLGEAGFIFLCNMHWFPVRSIGGAWWDLDSNHERPRLLSAADVNAIIGT